GDVEGADGRNGSAGGCRYIFGYCGDCGGGDHGHVVGAVDGDGDETAGGAVAREGGEAVGDQVGGAEPLNRGLGIVGAVGPATVGGERERTVGAGHAGLRGESGLALVNVGDREHAVRRQLAAEVNRNILGHVPA